MNILHFEYSDFFKMVMSDMVNRCGHHYESKSEGLHCLDILSQRSIDLIITGLELSDEKGEQMIKALNNSRYSKIPILIITSLDTENLQTRLKGLKFSDYIIKEQLTYEVLTQCLDRIEDEIELQSEFA